MHPIESDATAFREHFQCTTNIATVCKSATHPDPSAPRQATTQCSLPEAMGRPHRIFRTHKTDRARPRTLVRFEEDVFTIKESFTSSVHTYTRAATILAAPDRYSFDPFEVSGP
jgi:hypothetical protein